MKNFCFLIIVLTAHVVANGQTLKIDVPTPFIVKEAKTDIPVWVPIKLEKATKDCSVSFGVDKNSLASDDDYTIAPATKTVELNKSNDYSGRIEFEIKADDRTEGNETVILKLKFKDENDVQKETALTMTIIDKDNGSASQPSLSEVEKEKSARMSIEIFTGGTFDFFDALKFQKIGGELVVTANDLVGKDSRFGGFIGVSNFQNFTLDSSNANVRVQHIRIDTGAYVNGVTKYVDRTFVDHKKVSVNQWGYYVNPTFRLNKTRGNLFNAYVSFRLEALKTSTETEYKTDTLNLTDTTNRPLGSSPIFQAGKGFLLQKLVDTHTSGYFSIGLPIFITAPDKFKLYFHPNIGRAKYTYSTIMPSADRRSLIRNNYSVGKFFYLFRFRITEEFSGLNITVGGEIRDLFPSYNPTINAYLGVRANLEKLFKKN